MLLSAALIVRDEERSLGACLASLKGLADEVVVVDTGSSDRSRDIAAEAGARVYDRPWTGDFSAARNYALDLAQGDWISTSTLTSGSAAARQRARERGCANAGTSATGCCCGPGPASPLTGS